MRRRTQLLNLLTHTLQIIRRLLASGNTSSHRNNRLTAKALKEAGMLQLIRGNSLLKGINTLGGAYRRPAEAGSLPRTG